MKTTIPVFIALGIAAGLFAFAQRKCSLESNSKPSHPTTRSDGAPSPVGNSDENTVISSEPPAIMALEPRGAATPPAEAPPINHFFSNEFDLGVVRDKAGRIILRSNSKNIGIHICRESPDGLRALVAEVDGEYALVGMAGEPLVKLPSPVTEGDLRPEYYWLDDSMLLVVSADVRQPLPGQSSAEEPEITKTRLFTYEIKSGQFTEIPTGGRLPVSVFTVLEVRNGGILHIVQDHTEAFPGDMGWFNIRRVE